MSGAPPAPRSGPATERVRLRRDGAFVVDAWGPGAEWLVERAPELCGALDNPDAFRPDQPLLRDLVHCHPGLRIGRTRGRLRDRDVRDARAARRDPRRVAELAAAWSARWASRRRARLRACGCRPSPERIAHTPYEVFHRFGIERRRADVLRRLAVVAQRLEETRRTAARGRLSPLAARSPASARGPPRASALIALGDPDAVRWATCTSRTWSAGAWPANARGSDERMLRAPRAVPRPSRARHPAAHGGGHVQRRGAQMTERADQGNRRGELQLDVVRVAERQDVDAKNRRGE